MDNFSQQIGEQEDGKVLTQESLESQEGSDIVFEETVDIAELQKNIQKQIDASDAALESAETIVQESEAETESEDNDEVSDTDTAQEEIFVKAEEPEESEDSDDDIDPNILQEMQNLVASVTGAKNTNVEIPPDSKKYVIYVESENIGFMDSLSANDRKLIINKILKDQNEEAIKRKQIEAKQRFFAHSLVVAFTVIISFPIMFYAVNKATEVTIDNYKQAKENFSKLYREKGKIRPFGSATGEMSNY